MSLTPCQKCKAEREALRTDNAELTEKCYASARKLIEANQQTHRAERERDRWMKLSEARAALLLEAITRLNDFLSAYEGAPEPSENDTKALVARLHDALQTPETP